MVPETRVFQAANGEDLVVILAFDSEDSVKILACTIFDWSTHVTDGQTDRQTDRETDRQNCDG